MSDTPDVWASSEASAPASSATPGTLEAGEAPPVVRILSETFDDFKDNMGPYLMLGLGAAAVMFPITFVVVFVAIVPMIAAMVAENDTAVLASFAWYMLALLTGMLFVQAPVLWGTHRAVARHLDGEEGALGFGAMFSNMFDGLLGAVLLQAAIGVLTIVGAFFCYVPALIVACGVTLAMPAMAVHRLSVGRALSLSFGHLRDEPKWHLGFWALGLAIAMVGSNIPIVGLVFVVPFNAAYHIRGYRALYREAPE